MFSSSQNQGVFLEELVSDFYENKSPDITNYVKKKLIVYFTVRKFPKLNFFEFKNLKILSFLFQSKQNQYSSTNRIWQPSTSYSIHRWINSSIFIRVRRMFLSLERTRKRTISSACCSRTTNQQIPSHSSSSTSKVDDDEFCYFFLLGYVSSWWFWNLIIIVYQMKIEKKDVRHCVHLTISSIWRKNGFWTRTTKSRTSNSKLSRVKIFKAKMRQQQSQI